MLYQKSISKCLIKENCIVSNTNYRKEAEEY